MESQPFLKNRLIIVSNRLPIVLKKNKQSELEVLPGSGGLVTAMAPVLKNRGGIWIGWPGTISEEVSGEKIEDLLEKEIL
jgi:trehalose-6-phosphate synthase